MSRTGIEAEKIGWTDLIKDWSLWRLTRLGAIRISAIGHPLAWKVVVCMRQRRPDWQWRPDASPPNGLTIRNSAETGFNEVEPSSPTES